ncbi:MAG: hypothetical protein P4N24_15540 [Acidobacteriota bacterium]|nr:hypothetical protein [Acidobacteriota bacterium]
MNWGSTPQKWRNDIPWVFGKLQSQHRDQTSSENISNAASGSAASANDKKTCNQAEDFTRQTINQGTQKKDHVTNIRLEKKPQAGMPVTIYPFQGADDQSCQSTHDCISADQQHRIGFIFFHLRAKITGCPRFRYGLEDLGGLDFSKIALG